VGFFKLDWEPAGILIGPLQQVCARLQETE
jgi:hypothetical protein